MELEIYKNRQLDGARNNPQTWNWCVNINVRGGLMNINLRMRDDLNLDEPGMKAMVAKSGDGDDWYLAFGKDFNKVKSHPLRIYRNRCSRGGMQFHCRKAVIDMAQKVKATTGATLTVSRKPIKIDGVEWYKINHKRPMRVN